jgi:hypothetical protein
MLMAAAIALLAAPAAAAAPAQLPVGEADGVRVVDGRGGLVVVFTPSATRLWQRVAGRRVSVFCTDLPETHSAGGDFVSSGGATFRAPRRGRRLDTGDLTGGLDYCRVWLAAHTVKRHGERRRIERELIVSIPLTQQGAVHLDEETRAQALMSLLTYAGIEAEERHSSGWPAADAVTRLGGRLERWLGFGVEALANPGDTPPADTLGYYSDGGEHVAVAIVSAAGRRLFIELDADDVLRTNVSGYMNGHLIG